MDKIRVEHEEMERMDAIISLTEIVNKLLRSKILIIFAWDDPERGLKIETYIPRDSLQSPKLEIFLNKIREIIAKLEDDLKKQDFLR